MKKGFVVFAGLLFLLGFTFFVSADTATSASTNTQSALNVSFVSLNPVIIWHPEGSPSSPYAMEYVSVQFVFKNLGSAIPSSQLRSNPPVFKINNFVMQGNASYGYNASDNNSWYAYSNSLEKGQYASYLAQGYFNTSGNIKMSVVFNGSVYTNTTTVLPNPGCYSSNGGNIYQPGWTIGTTACANQSACVTSVRAADVCQDSNTLLEFSCASDPTGVLRMYGNPVTCSQGCLNGACVQSPGENSSEPFSVPCSSGGYKCTDSANLCSSAGGFVAQGYSCEGSEVCCALSGNATSSSEGFNYSAFCAVQNGTLCDTSDHICGEGILPPGSDNPNPNPICCLSKCIVGGVNHCSLTYNGLTYNYSTYYGPDYNQTCDPIMNVTKVVCTSGQVCSSEGNSNTTVCKSGGESTVCLSNDTTSICFNGNSCPLNSSPSELPQVTKPYIGPGNTPSCVSGCIYQGKCLPLGYRVSGNYCGISGTLTPELSSGACDNNFQCSSNLCVNSQCVTESFLQQIINFFKRLFGISDNSGSAGSNVTTVSGSSQTDTAITQVSGSISSSLSSEGKTLSVYPASNTIAITKGSQPAGFAFSVVNSAANVPAGLNSVMSTFVYNVTAKDVSNCNGISLAAANSYIINSKGSVSVEGPVGASSSPEMVLFSIPASAPSCTIVYRLNVVSSSNEEVGSDDISVTIQ